MLFGLITLFFLALVALPVIGQIHFGKKRLKRESRFPLYSINLSAIILEAIVAYTCSIVMINVFFNDSNTDEELCATGVASFFGIGILMVFFVQPLIALTFYLTSFKR